MIKVENIAVWGFPHAIRGMRNPLNSWDKADSKWINDVPGIQFDIGPKDLKLMKQLYKAGTEHRKYLRQIVCSFDVVAPLYWWKEFDTYKIGTVSNSCSTMHKIQAKEFEPIDFSTEHLIHSAMAVLDTTISGLNVYRQMYLETNDKTFWWQMIQLLPTSYNQRRTITMNYENVVTIIKQRTGHKLDEWNEFVEILSRLPYIKEITSEG